MKQPILKFAGASVLGIMLAFTLMGCGGGSPEPAESGTAQEESVAAETPEEPEQAEEPGEPDLAQGLTQHENDYLTIGIAEGWELDPEADENEHFEYEDSSGYGIALQYQDDTIARRSLFVSVYDEATYEWASSELPEESEYAHDIAALDPITVNGVEFTGYRSTNVSLSGDSYGYIYYSGVVNGHLVEIFLTDSSEGGILAEDALLMAQSLHIK